MLLVLLFLVATTLKYSQPQTIYDDSDYDSIDFPREKRDLDDDTIRRTFPEDDASKVCGLMHMTEETPFVAIVLYQSSGRFLCMGSIVDQSHVLSAKRCYDGTDVAELYVVVGYFKPYWGRHSQVLSVKKIIRHEYEVVLLRLVTPIQFGDFVQAVRLPSAVSRTQKELNTVYPSPYQIVGFFVDRYDVPGDYMSRDKIYRVSEDYYMSIYYCRYYYPKFIIEPSKVFCTEGNATYCWGGWGAPILIHRDQGYFVQIGMIIADNCRAERTGPFLAIRTDVYADWIRGNTFHGRQPS